MKQYAPIIALALALSGCATFGLGKTDGTVETTTVPDESETKDQTPKDDVEDPLDFVLESASVMSREFTFASHGETLTGELVMPDGPPIPRPAVVIVPDSGPLSRDGIMRGAFGVQLPVEVAVYRSLAEDLASRGFVVLIYDKRTCLKGSQPWCEYPREYIDGHVESVGQVLVQDLDAAIAALRADSRTSNVIHLVGHGQGAEVALSSSSTEVTSFVLAAPNTQAPDEMVLTQMERSIEALRARVESESNAETDAMKQQLDGLTKRNQELRESFRKIRAGEGDETAGLPAATWRSLFALHEQAAKAEPTAPVLVINAAMDLDVDEESREAMMKVWSDAGAEVVTFDEVTRPLVSVSDDEDPTAVSNQVTQKIATFLISATGPSSDRR